MDNVFLISILTVGAFYDIRERRVPNKLILNAIVIAFITDIVQRHYFNIVQAIIVFGVLYLIYMIRDTILPGGDIKGLVFIVMTKGIGFFAIAAYYMLLTAIPVLIYIIIKSKIKKSNDVPPLYLPMLLGCIIAGGII